MIPPELISMGIGSLVGFVFKFMSQRAKERHEIFKMNMQKEQMKIDSSDAAAQRENDDAGKKTRRIIVLSTLFAVIFAPFWLSLLDIPMIIQINETRREWFFGLFGGGINTYFVKANGYLIIPEVRQALSALIGYYFGNASAK
jgi:hypothetical protein